MLFQIITLRNDNINKTNHGYDLTWTPKKKKINNYVLHTTY